MADIDCRKSKKIKSQLADDFQSDKNCWVDENTELSTIV